MALRAPSLDFLDGRSPPKRQASKDAVPQLYFPTLSNEDVDTRFTRVGSLGRGSYGKAHLVKDSAVAERKDVTVVLKQLFTANENDGNREQTMLEAHLLARMRHPNIVRFYDAFFSQRGRVCIVMEYADGGDLHKWIKARDGKLVSESECLSYFVQVCLALKHIHDKRVIHRDLKTQNIFLTKRGMVKLGDFGISRLLNGTNDLARTMVGTPYYLSPEIIEEKPYSYSSDVWSLGVVLYELCTLRHPFTAENLHTLAPKILKGNFEDPSGDHYSKDMAALIRSMLRQNPNDRPSATDVLRLPYLKLTINFVGDTYGAELKEQAELADSGTLHTPINKAPAPGHHTTPRTRKKFVDRIRDLPNYSPIPEEMPLSAASVPPARTPQFGQSPAAEAADARHELSALDTAMAANLPPPREADELGDSVRAVYEEAVHPRRLPSAEMHYEADFEKASEEEAPATAAAAEDAEEEYSDDFETYEEEEDSSDGEAQQEAPRQSMHLHSPTELDQFVKSSADHDLPEDVLVGWVRRHMPEASEPLITQQVATLKLLLQDELMENLKRDVRTHIHQQSR